MATTEAPPAPPPPAPPPGGSTAWTRVLRGGAIAEIVGFVVIMALSGVIIPPLAVFVVLLGVGLFLLRRPGKVGPIWLGVVSLFLLVTNIPVITESLAVPASIFDFVITLLLILASLVAVMAAIALLTRAGDSSGRIVGWAGIILFVLGVAFSVVSNATFEGARPGSGDVSLQTSEFEFSDESLEADSGEITVVVENVDPVLHTFTIDELDVNVNLPAGKTAATTFEAEPGEYQFYCAITGHEDLMNGTIEVR